MSAAPDWLKVGAEVASVTDPRGMGIGRRVKRARVEKIGKRDVVLDDGERFNVNRLTRQDGGTWGPTTRLMAADDPFVTQVVAEIRQENIAYRAKHACENFRYGRDGVTAADAILALAPLTGVADEIAALFDPKAAS